MKGIRKNGVLQIPAVSFGSATPGSHSKDPLGWHTGIRCPRCQRREVIYNGNYFCAGYGDLFEDRVIECGWALPEDDPHYALLEKALIKTQTDRPS